MAFIAMKSLYGSIAVHESQVERYKALGYSPVDDMTGEVPVTGLDEVVEDLHPTIEQMEEGKKDNEAEAPKETPEVAEEPKPKRTRRKS